MNYDEDGRGGDWRERLLFFSRVLSEDGLINLSSSINSRNLADLLKVRILLEQMLL